MNIKVILSSDQLVEIKTTISDNLSKLGKNISYDILLNVNTKCKLNDKNVKCKIVKLHTKNRTVDFEMENGIKICNFPFKQLEIKDDIKNQVGGGNTTKKTSSKKTSKEELKLFDNYDDSDMYICE